MNYLQALYQKALAAAKDYYAREPAKANGYVTAAVVAVAGVVGVAATSVAVLPVVGFAVPLILATLLSAEKTRQRVTPVQPLPSEQATWAE